MGIAESSTGLGSGDASIMRQSFVLIHTFNAQRGRAATKKNNRSRNGTHGIFYLFYFRERSLP
jgi:hypothetical protein